MRLALTHGHGDHILGSAPLIGIDTYAHVAAPATMRRQIKEIARRTGESLADLRARLAWPNVTFDASLFMDLGDKQVSLLHTPGHSPDGVCVYVQEDRLLFGGDTVVTGIVPAIGDGDSRALEASLRRLAQLDIAILVPGHGPVVRGQQEATGWLQGWAEYLAHVREAVRDRLARGGDPVHIADGLGFAAFVRGRVPAERHDMLNRHRRTVDKIVREELQEAHPQGEGR